ncbi:hypothetical protein Poli38472_010159 [Pythium oligandrum]|uniref:Arrestin-like N-terminal domain-containing protein n=1 Tax=Pythium oligandrum TaxID=41045 RepID=A0A8K1C8U5_PYTOL|nr:hypothetical protein Poli38472_010159 [Pythium oligandrum]|eukprot:TMW58600.1 hypothetical protein Poli38472_010159 [Pythium oligandrum]
MGKHGDILPLQGHGAVCVCLDNTTVQAGGSVNGLVQLAVTKAIDVTALDVEFSGNEHLKWDENAERCSKTHRIHSNKATLLTPPSPASVLTLAPGNYSYPFVFQLPNNLTPSFAFKSWCVDDIKNVQVMVDYEISLNLGLEGDLKANVKWSVPLNLEAPASSYAPSMETKPLTASTTQVVRPMGLFSRGKCDVTLEMEKDVHDTKSPIPVRVTVENASKQSLQAIHLVLYEDVTIDRYLAGKNRLCQTSRVVCARRFNHKEIKSNGALSLALPLLANDLYRLKPLQPTMRSHFIHSLSYRIGVECALTASGRAKVSAPVRIIQAANADNMSGTFVSVA